MSMDRPLRGSPESLEERALSQFLAAAASKHQLELPAAQRLVCALLDYWQQAEPAALVNEIHLGYQPEEQSYHLLLLLSEDWQPRTSAEPHAPTPEERRHRLLFEAMLVVWRRYPGLLFDTHPVPTHWFPGSGTRAIFDRVMPAGTVYLGAVSLPRIAAPTQ